MSDLLGTIRGFFTGETETFAPLGNALAKLATDLEPITARIGDYLATIITSFNESLGSAESGVQDFIVEKIGQIPEALEATIDAAQAFAPIVQKVFDDLRAGVEGFVEQIGQDGIEDVFTLIQAALKGAVIATVAFADVFATLAPAVGSVLNPILDIAAGIVSLAEAFKGLGPIVDIIIFAMGTRFIRTFTTLQASGVGVTRSLGTGFLSMFRNVEKTNAAIQKTTGSMGTLGARTATLRTKFQSATQAINRATASNKEYEASLRAIARNPRIRVPLPETSTARRLYTEQQIALLSADRQVQQFKTRASAAFSQVATFAKGIGSALVGGFVFGAVFSAIDLVKSEMSEAKEIAAGVGEAFDEGFARLKDREFLLSDENAFNLGSTAGLEQAIQDVLGQSINDGNRRAWSEAGIETEKFAELFVKDQADALEYAANQIFDSGGTFAKLTTVPTIDPVTGAESQTTASFVLSGEEAAAAFNESVQAGVENGLSLNEAMRRNIRNIKFGKEEGAFFLERWLGLDDANIDDLLLSITPEMEDSMRTFLRDIEIGGSDLQKKLLDEFDLSGVDISNLEGEELFTVFAEFIANLTAEEEKIQAAFDRINNIFDGNFSALSGNDLEASQTIALINNIGDAFEDGKLSAEAFQKAVDIALGVRAIDPTDKVRESKDLITRFLEESGLFDTEFGPEAALGPEFFDMRRTAAISALDPNENAGQLEALNLVDQFRLRPEDIAPDMAQAFAGVETTDEAIAIADSFREDFNTRVNQGFLTGILTPEAVTSLQSEFDTVSASLLSSFFTNQDVQASGPVQAVLDAMRDNPEDRQMIVDLALNVSEEDQQNLFRLGILQGSQTEAELILTMNGFDTSDMAPGIASMMESRLREAQGTFTTSFVPDYSGIDTKMLELLQSGVTTATMNIILNAPNLPDTYSVTGRGSGPDGSPLNGALGGIFTQPTRRTIGEAGAELVLPLTRPARAMALLESLGMSRGEQRPTTMVNSNTSYTINGVDPGQVAALIAAKQEAINLRIGASL